MHMHKDGGGKKHLRHITHACLSQITKLFQIYGCTLSLPQQATERSQYFAKIDPSYPASCLMPFSMSLWVDKGIMCILQPTDWSHLALFY